jgi:DNA-binding IclR family transcriptional regulator
MESESSILAKAFDVLATFDDKHRVFTLSEIAVAAGLPKSTVHRIIQRLLALRVLERHGSGYRIGLRLLSMSSVTPASAFRDTALPHLRALHGRVRETVQLGVLRGPDVVYLEKIRHPGSCPTPSMVGGSSPANTTAVGKALLAHEASLEDLINAPLTARTLRSITDPAVLHMQLKHFRERGIATETEESSLGVACVAAPIICHGHAVAAVSVAVRSAHGNLNALETAVRETARDIARVSTRAGARQDWIPPVS